jgi:type III pantothenate kinase
MLLAVDIGNTNTKFGIFDGDTLLSKFQVPTTKLDQLETIIGDRLDHPVTAAMVCSVVPAVERQISGYISAATAVKAEFVRNDQDLGLKVSYKPLESLGTDRLVNAAAAAIKYDVPFIVCSFGTAVTMDVVTTDREFIGGLIAPGIDTLARALHLNTADLPDISIELPDSTIQNTTAGSINAGVGFGYIDMVDGLLRRIKGEAGYAMRVIGTGGSVSLISGHTKVLHVVDEDLLLDGLRLISQRRQPA